VPRGIFGLKRKEVTGLRKLHNEKLHNLCPKILGL
jgi:hypothetical protein